MGKILLGVILILLGGTINTGRYIIELTPNFIGSLLLLLALRDFKIKDRRIIGSLWVLMGIYSIIYIIHTLIPNSIPFALTPVIFGGTLLWGVFIAIKIVDSVKNNQEKGEELKLTSLRKWFRILLIITIIMIIAVIGYTLSKECSGVLNILSLWVFSLAAFGAIIPRYALIYCFYKEFKNIKSTN